MYLKPVELHSEFKILPQKSKQQKQHCFFCFLFLGRAGVGSLGPRTCSDVLCH